MIRKLKTLLLIAFFIFPVVAFSVGYEIIDDVHPRYNEIIQRLPKQKASPAILHVYFDGIPYGNRFLSGSNKPKMGDICPALLFSNKPNPNPDKFAEKAATLLGKHMFPIDRFNSVIILWEGLKNKGTEKNINQLESTLITLVGVLKRVKSAEDKKEYNPLKKKISVYTQTNSFLSKLKEYLEKRKEIYKWEQAWKQTQYAKNYLSPEEQKYIKSYNYANEIDEFYKKIQEHHDKLKGATGVKEQIHTYEKYYIEPKQDPYKLKLKCFCDIRGKHAEDALILSVLQKLQNYSKIPLIIEIYGSEDPCFQCQVKLQWFSSILVGNSQPPIEIYYYSKNGFEGNCLYADVQIEKDMGKEKFRTRPLIDEGKLAKFTFTNNGNDTQYEPLLFSFPKKMSMGIYEGKVIKKSGKNTYNVKVTEIVNLKKDKEEHKKVLEAFYQSREYIAVRLETDKGLNKDDIIKFEVIEDRSEGIPDTSKATFFVLANLITVISPYR